VVVFEALRRFVSDKIEPWYAAEGALPGRRKFKSSSRLLSTPKNPTSKSREDLRKIHQTGLQH
jgi:hypothetical protein